MARRIRWLSPPESVPADRLSVRYSSPYALQKAQTCFDLLQNGAAISFSRSVSSSPLTNSNASVTDLSQNSLILIPPTVTARLSGKAACPRLQETALIYVSISSLTQLEELSRKRRSRLLMTRFKFRSIGAAAVFADPADLIFSPLVP